MEAERKRLTRVRNPLSDCTNTINSSQSSSTSSKTALSVLRKSRKSVLSSAIGKFIADANTKPAAGSDVAGSILAVPPPPIHGESTPLCPSQRPSLDLDKSEGIEPCSVYTRRHSAKKMKSASKANEEHLSNALTSVKKKSKGKENDAPLSCPPATKILKIGESTKNDELKILRKACTTLRKKKKGCRPCKKDSDHLSQDYIEQQRAYFAEIDAFELPEEEVESISDLD